MLSQMETTRRSFEAEMCHQKSSTVGEKRTNDRNNFRNNDLTLLIGLQVHHGVLLASSFVRLTLLESFTQIFK